MQGSSIDKDIVAQVKHAAAAKARVLVILDSNHSAAHVRAELDAYAALLTPGSFIIAMDGYLMELGAPDRPGLHWATDNANAGVRAFVADHPEFAAEEPDVPFNESSLNRAVTGFRFGLGGLLWLPFFARCKILGGWPTRHITAITGQPILG